MRNGDVEADSLETIEYDVLTRTERRGSPSRKASGEDVATFVPGSRGLTLETQDERSGNDMPFFEKLVLEDGDWRETNSADEDVIGTDERAKVTDTQVWPFRCVGLIRTTYPNGKRYIGSGVLVSRNCVLTCAHNIYNKKRGGWGKIVEFRPAQNGPSAPYGMTAATKLLATSGYTDAAAGASLHDYAVVVLNRAFGDELGWWGYAIASDDFLASRSLSVTGYPGDKGGREMWTCEGTVEGGPEYLQYDIDTDNGQSGGPVWTQTSDQVVSYGIHITGTSGGNSAVRLTTARFNEVRSWLDANVPATAAQEPTILAALARFSR